MTRVCLGVDPPEGWAVLADRGNAILARGHWSKGVAPEVYLSEIRSVVAICRLHGVTAAGIEQQFHAGAHGECGRAEEIGKARATIGVAQLAGWWQMALTEAGIPWAMVDVDVAHRVFVGKPPKRERGVKRNWKHETRDACRMRYPGVKLVECECDAVRAGYAVACGAVPVSSETAP